ncbi:MAG: hypothetical protein ACOXZ9_10385 [Bacteroidales bacterium]
MNDNKLNLDIINIIITPGKYILKKLFQSSIGLMLEIIATK